MKAKNKTELQKPALGKLDAGFSVWAHFGVFPQVMYIRQRRPCISPNHPKSTSPEKYPVGNAVENLCVCVASFLVFSYTRTCAEIVNSNDRLKIVENILIDFRRFLNHDFSTFDRSYTVQRYRGIVQQVFFGNHVFFTTDYS